MSDTRNVKIKQEPWDAPINVKTTGFRACVLPLLVASIALSTCATEMNTRDSVKIQKQRLEVAKKQYTLDSLRFEYIKSHQK